MQRKSRSAEVKKRLSHPVVDGDGHWIEPFPVFADYLDAEAGPSAVDAWRTGVFGTTRRMSGNTNWLSPFDWYELSPERRQEVRSPRGVWWGIPTETLDRATSFLPGLMYERLDDFGIDFAIVYTTLGLQMGLIPDPELRHASIRAINTLNSEWFAPFADRLAPVAVIPTQDPDEAIAEVSYAVSSLGFKAIMMSGTVPRRTTTSEYDLVVDTIGLDSPHDYDPLWQTCVELGVAVTDHGGSWYWPDRRSPTNMVFNHIGHFASGLQASCRGIFLGGVPNRFPSLRFAFLEGGVGWAANLLAGLVGYWEKRNPVAMAKNMRPTNVNVDELRQLVDLHGGPRLKGRFDEILAAMDLQAQTEREQECLDDFAASGVSSPRDIEERFSKSFYFGCEADDPMTAVAFDPRLRTRLKAMFSSDIGHFDVIDMTDVLHEAWELVEDGMITEADFRQFTFSNVVELHTANNPEFFAGSVVEKAVKGLT